MGVVAGPRNLARLRTSCDRYGGLGAAATAEFDALARPCPFNSMAPVPAVADMVADPRRPSTGIVTPLERLIHPPQPGRTGSDSHEEDRHGGPNRTESEAAQGIGSPAASPGSWPGDRASSCRRDRRRQQFALRG